MQQVEQSYRTGAMRVVDVPAPQALPGQNLVATKVSLISAGTERQIIDLAKSSLAGKARARPDLVRKVIAKARQEGVANTARKVFAKLDTPIPLGYSLAGTIMESNRDAGNFTPGTRVACAGAAVANHAQFNAVPKHLTVPIPARVSDDDAAFVTLGAIAMQGVRVAQPTLGERALVIGLGLLGQLTVQLLKANGCRVIGYDPHPDRARLALEMGADAVTSEDPAALVANETRGVGADFVIITASSKSSAPVNQAAELSRMKGRVVMVGMVGLELDREPFYKRELDLRLSMSYGPGRYDPAYENDGHDYPLPYVRWTEQRNMEAFLELIAQGRVTPAKLVTHRFPIDRAEDAYALLASSEPYLAVLLDYPQQESPPEHAIRVAPTHTGGDAVPGSGIGFIGMGNYARSVLLPAVTASGKAHLHSVVTASGLSARNAAEKFGFAVAATDPAAALADPDVATVFVATRHDTHAALAVAALEAGRNVFVEKPLALDHASLAEVMASAEASDGILTVGFNRRFAPLLVAARGAAASTGGPLLMHYRVNAGYIPPESWVHGSEGGGRIAGEACHFVDALSTLCGADPLDVTVVATPGHDDAIQAIVRFADGSTGHILYTSLGDPSVPKERIEAFGQNLVISLDDFRELRITRSGRTQTTKARQQDKGQRALVDRFLDACKSGGPPPIAYATLSAVSRVTLLMAGIEP
ncbi:bi-domain-containing oxidoreductase [Novosphingobium tardum]|uniref:Bi-domain-containing oxidoreductase n=1 Tax=Novosphingobium tardum TaxID=1538021 RepID=A0ABV8RP22_9SPHN